MKNTFWNTAVVKRPCFFVDFLDFLDTEFSDLAYKIPEVVACTDTCTNMQLKKNLLEALGWHGTAYTADRIRELALRTSQNDTLPADVRDEALKTFKRTSFVKL